MNNRYDEATFRQQRKRARIEENERGDAAADDDVDNEEVEGGEVGNDNEEDEEETAIELGYEITLGIFLQGFREKF